MPVIDLKNIEQIENQKKMIGGKKAFLSYNNLHAIVPHVLSIFIYGSPKLVYSKYFNVI